MTLWTLSEIKTKVNNDLDLTNETMISSAELTAYINQAVQEAEQHVIAIYEDYFLQKSYLTLVTSTSDYALPTNIYGHKIRKVIYDDGTNKYLIKRIRKLEEIPYVDTNDDYRYMIVMDGTGAFKLRLFPTSRENSSTTVNVWHIGSANVLSADADIMNIPEAAQYVISKTKLECARKEGHPAQMSLEQETDRQRKLLIETLTVMVPDEDNQVLMDLSFYGEFDANRGW